MLDRTKIYDLSGITENQWQDLKWYLGRDHLDLKVKGSLLKYINTLEDHVLAFGKDKWELVKTVNVFPFKCADSIPVLQIPELDRRVFRLKQTGGDNITRDFHLYYDVKAGATGKVTVQELPYEVEVTFLEISNWGDEIFVTLIDRDMKTYTISVEEYERLMAEQKSYELTLYSPIEVIGKKRKFIKSL